MNTEIAGNTYGKWTVLEVFKDGRYWMCKSVCVCNKIKIHRMNVLTGGKSKSCKSCRDRSSWDRKIPKPLTDENAFTKVYGSYRNKATRKKLPFSLSREITKYLMLKNCFYCDEKPSNVTPAPPDRKGLVFTYNGLDRLDSNKGYDINNVLPCCKYCNRMKSDLTFDEFIQRIMKISKRWDSRIEMERARGIMVNEVRNIYAK